MQWCDTAKIEKVYRVIFIFIKCYQAIIWTWNYLKKLFEVIIFIKCKFLQD